MVYLDWYLAATSGEAPCKIPVLDRNGGIRLEECWAQADDPLRGRIAIIKEIPYMQDGYLKESLWRGALAGSTKQWEIPYMQDGYLLVFLEKNICGDVVPALLDTLCPEFQIVRMQLFHTLPKMLGLILR
eukprot:gene17740-biopygen5113